MVLLFGAVAFQGAARFLEIQVRPSASVDPADFVQLEPRQKLSANPYALHAVQTGEADLALDAVVAWGSQPDSSDRVGTDGNPSPTNFNPPAWQSFVPDNDLYFQGFTVYGNFSGARTGEIRIYEGVGVAGEPLATHAIDGGSGDLGVRLDPVEWIPMAKGLSYTMQILLTGNTTGTLQGFFGNVYPAGQSSLGEDVDLRFRMDVGFAKPVLSVANGNPGMVSIDGGDNNGTSAVLALKSGSQTMLLDGNEIDSNGELFLNSNSKGHVHVPVLVIDGGADIAEPFQVANSTAETIPAGSVMVIDASNPGHLKLSTQAYDHRVAGIISGAGGVNTGLTLQQKNVLDGGVNVVLTGRVYSAGSDHKLWLATKVLR